MGLANPVGMQAPFTERKKLARSMSYLSTVALSIPFQFLLLHLRLYVYCGCRTGRTHVISGQH